ncbi:hypothetical protein DBR06_SOUSAS3810131, partial [Sousa chinensis]
SWLSMGFNSWKEWENNLDEE